MNNQYDIACTPPKTPPVCCGEGRRETLGEITDVSLDISHKLLDLLDNIISKLDGPFPMGDCCNPPCASYYDATCKLKDNITVAVTKAERINSLI